MSDSQKVADLFHRVGDILPWRQESDKLDFHAAVVDAYPAVVDQAQDNPPLVADPAAKGTTRK